MIQYREESYEIFSLSLYSGRACASIINDIRSSNAWSGAKVRKHIGNGKYRSVQMTSVRQARILNRYLTANTYDDFDRRMDRKVKPLIKDLWRADLKQHYGTQFVRYQPNGHYDAHTDRGVEYRDRYFTVLCYLNDDFEGGHTFFPYLNYRAVPESGKTIIFPSSYLHCAEPVLKGEKFIALTWVMGPTPVEWI
jgi:predicted 2-oxoglutarate/Fe(II)-dependent dioxygenase YbiX